ncbi:hypothetical protein GC105_00815 [Alkalibaculum sp. M08DMB]|uniref:CdaR GGDEF-like domain-containing protein n=1 Tax=Alkalibaculum sporogenes TaxID=2655001 RepID=A0A6A7K4U1_9FIRM|nr:hypothetical protein [Alkalibaculum sporogenes]
MIKLLEGKITDATNIEDNCNLFRLNFTQNTAIMTFSIDESEVTNTNLDYCRNKIEEILEDSNSIIYNGHIVFILTTSNQNTLKDSTTKNLKNTLRIMLCMQA